MILCLDTETTGVDASSARLVTAFLGLMDPQVGTFTRSLHLLVDPGVEIPEGASSVHGITTERARAEGIDPKTALEKIRAVLEAEAQIGRVPIVIFNASYDATLLEAEFARHDTPSFDWADALIIDPLIIDKAVDKYRRGSRKLVDMAPVYGVPVETNAHDASADCLMAGRIALKQLQRSTADYYHQHSPAWKAEQAAGLEKYFLKQGKTPEEAYVDPGWPLQHGSRTGMEAVA